MYLIGHRLVGDENEHFSVDYSGNMRKKKDANA
jgi:hypothetical protein